MGMDGQGAGQGAGMMQGLAGLEMAAGHHMPVGDEEGAASQLTEKAGRLAQPGIGVAGEDFESRDAK